VDSLKTWIVEVALKKIGPTVAASLISSLFAFLAIHQGLLESWGITYGIWPLHWGGTPPSGHVILIELDTISSTALTGLGVLITGLMVAAQHHTVAAIEGKPQSGDMRRESSPPVFDGKRAQDPPTEVSK
jgi:hypothetical protein